jgi:hypothetical protein
MVATTVPFGKGPIEVTGHWGPKQTSEGGSTNVSRQQSQQSSAQSSYQAAQMAQQASSFGQTYIPEYAESPILRSIAQQAQGMAPEVYQWGMQQYQNNQSNIDAMMRNALTYASPQRQAVEMGKAEANVQQGAEQGRQNAIKDLQSFGVDPSSGRYAALDQASQVMSGAAAAGAGNVQREATVAQGAGMANQAQANSLSNVQTGYGAAAGANALLGTAMQLKFPPLGQMSGSQSSQQSSSVGTSSGSSQGSSSGSTLGGSSQRSVTNWAQGGGIPDEQAGDNSATAGGFVSSELSPSAGASVDDVQARLNSGEFVIPKDVAAWKGQEFFYRLMAQSRKTRAMAEAENGTPASDAPQTGYLWGGGVAPGKGPIEQTGHWGPKEIRTGSSTSSGSSSETGIENYAGGGVVAPMGGGGMGGGVMSPSQGGGWTGPVQIGVRGSQIPVGPNAPDNYRGGASAGGGRGGMGGSMMGGMMGGDMFANNVQLGPSRFNQQQQDPGYIDYSQGGIPPVTGYGIGYEGYAEGGAVTDDRGRTIDRSPITVGPYFPGPGDTYYRGVGETTISPRFLESWKRTNLKGSSDEGGRGDNPNLDFRQTIPSVGDTMISPRFLDAWKRTNQRTRSADAGAGGGPAPLPPHSHPANVPAIPRIGKLATLADLVGDEDLGDGYGQTA